MPTSQRPARPDGIVFIGPSSESIRTMGSKTSARRLAKAAGAPVVPGTDRGRARASRKPRASPRELGYPVLLKAAAGGGGKGMRRVDREADLEARVARRIERSRARVSQRRDVRREADRAARGTSKSRFSATATATMIHLGERECSIQRRHQKVIEECPSPLVVERPELRQAMGEAAIRVARAAGYYNAGTVEFLVDEARELLLPRDEHAASGGASGDGAGHGPRPGAPAVADRSGRAADARAGRHRVARVGASSAAFTRKIPTTISSRRPGSITRLSGRPGPGSDWTAASIAGWNVPIDYDPLLAKLAVWAENRATPRSRECSGRLASITSAASRPT